MKKHFNIIILTIALFSSCGNDGKVKELELQNQTLQEETIQQEKAVNELLSSINLIQENLNEIKNREGIIRVNTGENGLKTDIEAINKDIELISDLMKRNESLMIDLHQQLQGANTKNAELLRLVKNLQNQLKDRNQKIAALNNELLEKKIKIGQLYFSLDSLNYVNKAKDTKLEKRTDQLYEAYYAYGTFKELKEKNVLSKEGGILGLGSKESLSENFNKEYFSKIDIREQTSFLILSKKAELVTNHPSNSYEFMGEKGSVDSLVITNAEEFWGTSKYMVIVVDGYQNRLKSSN